MHQPKEMAWNGVRFRIPSTWEISLMGQRYLQLEDDDGPVFELKWQTVKGRFSHASHLKKMGAGRWFDNGAQVETCELPEGWTAALERYSARAFQWQGPDNNGQGAVLYCAQCETALLLQFLRRDIVDNHDLCAGVLASLHDHPLPAQNGSLRWAVYDLRADIPRSFRLRNYRFDAGAFALEFNGASRSYLSLRRWGPASLVLAHQTLRQFVTGQVAWANGWLRGNMVEEGNFVHLEGAFSPNPWAQWFRRLRRRPVFHWLHAWHDEAHNRILAVDAHGSLPLPRDVLQQVSDHYVMV